ncbi:hypothetical protein QYM36_015306 [Artemia franciscana]|uniref:Reverse transcriptase domain-containing protein n=1 Tax=Artemia franciscana TaxID=6661 RepID=A0AA88HKU3_ARTSF|nr:hypothetical protein QYM36_015306 [Artemia franciscana]
MLKQSKKQQHRYDKSKGTRDEIPRRITMERQILHFETRLTWPICHRILRAKYQINGRCRPVFKKNTGVRQGCATTPGIFNTIIDYVVDRATNCCHIRLQFGDRVLSDCNFTVDIALVCTTVAELEEALTKLSGEPSKPVQNISW